MCVLALSAVVFLAWISGANGEFVWIDHVEIEDAGYRVTNWSDFKQVWQVSLDQYTERQSGTVAAEGGYFRPVYALLISLDWEIWGNDPFAFHLVNIFVHAMVVGALFALGLYLLWFHENRLILAFSAALLFSVHPFGVHSVTWISGRKDSLCALFSIVALLGLGSFLIPRKSRSRCGTVAIIGLAVVSLNVGLLCKELAIVTPAFATMWIWFASAKSRIGPGAFWLLGLFWLSSVFALVYRKILLGGIGLNIGYPAESLFGNVMTSLSLVWQYFVRVLIPGEPTIVDRYPIVSVAGPFECFMLGLFVCAGVLLCWMILRRNHYGLLLCWFLIWLLPATGIVPLRHMYAERYLYPASWGLLFLAVVAVDQLVRLLGGNGKVTFGLVCGVGLVFSVMTFSANRVWKQDKSLFENSVQQDEHYVEGLSALVLLALEHREYDKALSYAERAVSSANDPNYRSYWSPFGVYTNAGLAAYHVGDFERSALNFDLAAKHRPKSSLSYYHLGLVATARQEFQKAEFYYRQAIKIQPSDSLSLNNLAHICLLSQRFSECIELLNPVVAEEPDNELALINLGTAYLLDRDFVNAEEFFERVVALNPGNGLNLAKLAWAEFEIGQFKEGREHIEAAKAIAPSHPTILHVERTYADR